MSFARYPEYKDSGLEWLGHVPGHWKTAPLKTVSTHNDEVLDESTAPDAEIVYVDISSVDAVNGIKTKEAMPFSAAPSRARRRVKHGDVIVSTVRTYLKAIAKICAPEENLIVSTGFAVIRPRGELMPDFLGHLVAAGFFVEQVIARSTGVSYPAINASELVAISVPVPPLVEQTQIATFLDRETAKIDGLVAEQRRLMALLKEKRQAVISNAVTRGLNPDAPMKASGIEWLGDVPAHWEVRRVKDFFQTCSGGTPNTAQQELYYSDEENGTPWVRTTDLQNDVLRTVDIFITDKALADTACSVLPPGTVMVAMYGGDGTVGKNGLLAIPAAINQAVCGLLPSSTHSPEYAFRFMQFYRPHWMIGAESSRKDPNISQERVRNAPFPRPPLEEQDSIVSFLNSQLMQFDTLTAEAQHAIDLLQERRTALISAAVTGQIDVRELAEPQECERVDKATT